MDIIEKKIEILNAIVGFWDQAVTITSLGSNIYQCVTSSTHNFIKNSKFADKITIYDSADATYVLDTNYFQFELYENTNTTTFKVESPDVDLTTLTTPKCKLFTGHHQNVRLEEYENDGSGVYPISQYPLFCVLGIEDVYQDNTAIVIGYDFTIDIMDRVENHNLNSYDFQDRENSNTDLETEYFCVNRFEYIFSKLNIFKRNIVSYPFIHNGYNSENIRGYHCEFRIGKNNILRCD
jgi:hypothetical protein